MNTKMSEQISQKEVFGLDQLLHRLGLEFDPLGIRDLVEHNVSTFENQVVRLLDGKLVDGYLNDSYLGWTPLNNPITLVRFVRYKSGPLLCFKVVQSANVELKIFDFGIIPLSEPKFAFLIDATQQEVTKGLYLLKGHTYKSEAIYVVRR